MRCHSLILIMQSRQSPLPFTAILEHRVHLPSEIIFLCHINWDDGPLPHSLHLSSFTLSKINYEIMLVKRFSLCKFKGVKDILEQLRHVDGTPSFLRSMETDRLALVRDIANAADEIDKLRKENRKLKHENDHRRTA